MRSRRCVASFSALSVIVAGCYRYAPMTDGTPAPGADVRLALGPSATPELYRVLGDGTEAVEGRVTSASDAGYTLAVSGTRKTGQTVTTTWAGESVTIPRAAVVNVQRRTLDKKKTFGIAGIALLAAAGTKLLVDGFSSKSGGSDNGGTPPPTPP